MKHRRNIRQLTYSLQTGAAELFGILVHKAGSGCRLGGTSGEYYNDIVCNQLLHQLNVRGIRTDSRVIAAYHSHSAAKNAGSNALDQRLCGPGYIHLRVSHFVKCFNNCLYGVSYCSFLL